MTTFAASLHFVTTFLVAVGAFACVWLTLTRPEYAPSGWARVIFGAGWALLGVAETTHGAQVIGGDAATTVLAIRIAAYFLLLVSLLVPVETLTPGAAPGSSATGGDGERVGNAPGGGGTPGGRGGLWSLTLASFGRTAGPAVLGLMAAIFALRSRLEGARRLALALGLLGTSEIFLARTGPSTTTYDATWVAGHTLHLAAGLVLGFWLWRAYRVNIQARIVAALVLLLVIVIGLISATVTNVFVRNDRTQAFRSVGNQATFEAKALGEAAKALQQAASVVLLYPGVQADVQNRTTGTVTPNGPAALDLSGFAQRFQLAYHLDFVAFVTPDPKCAGQPNCGGSFLTLSAQRPDGSPTLDDTNLEEINLAGSAEVRSALGRIPAASVDDIGSVRSRLVIVGTSPIIAPVDGKTTVVGAAVVGQIVTSTLIGQLPLPGNLPVTVVGSHGELLGSTLPGADQVVRSRQSTIIGDVVRQGRVYSAEATAAGVPYYVVATPLTGQGGTRVGAVMVSQRQTLQATQQQVGRTLFLGALAATLVAVAAAAFSGVRLTRPIRQLTAAADRVRHGDLTARVQVAEADEVGVLGEAFNQMTASLDSQSRDLREAALKESRLRGELETILQSMTDGLIAVDRTGQILTINREAERITGVPAERARGLKVAQVLEVTDATGAQVDLPIFRLGGGSTAGLIAGTGPGRRGTPVAVTSAPIIDEAGTLTGAVAMLRDMTTEMEVETMKTEFLSNISHELRTPLTPIKGYADLLRRKVVPRAKSVSFLNVIVASTERMERIVDMLVDFSAMQAGRLMVRAAPFNLDRATAELVEKWQEAAPKHSFERTGFEGLPQVAGDPRLLPRAIDELIDNAVKFSPDGGPITIQGELDSSRPDRVRVSVTDHGIGITSEQMSQIFHDFVQVDASETRAFGGLGLGLAYVRRIIEAHDGELKVQSTPGEGSCFSLLIPLQRGAESSGPRAVDTGPVAVVPLRRSGFPSRRTPPEWPGRR